MMGRTLIMRSTWRRDAAEPSRISALCATPVSSLRLPAIDGVRGVAVLLVIGHHARLPYLDGMLIGVDIFFALSGFLITSQLVREYARAGRIDLLRFYLRRCLRLVPALLALCGFLSLYVTLVRPREESLVLYRATGFALTNMSNWVAAYETRSLASLYHTWSLSVEGQFYLVWPLVLIGMFGLRLRQIAMALTTLAFAGASIIHRAMMADAGATSARLFRGFDTRADALLIGCAAALLTGGLTCWPSRWRTILLQVLTFTSLVVFVRAVVVEKSDTGYLTRGGTCYVAAATAMLLVGLSHGAVPIITRALAFEPLTAVGRISYGLYLWNFPAVYILVRPEIPLEINRWLQVAATFSAAMMSYVLIEQPFLRLKERFGVPQLPTASTRSC